MAAQNWWEEVEEVDSPVAATEETPWWETVEEVGATAPAPTIPEPVEPTAIAGPVEADADKPWYEQVEIVEPIAPRAALPTIATEPQEGFLRPVADPFLNIAAGINDVVKGFSDAFGADNAVSQNLAKNSDWYRSLLSAGAKEDQEEIGRIMQEAEGQGVLAEIGAGLKALSVAPVDLVAQGIGSLIPFIATAGVGKAVGLSKAGIAVLQGVQGGAVGGGIVKGEIYSAVKDQLINSGVDEAKAEKAAQEAQAYNGKNLDQILLGVGLGVAASTSGADSAIRSLIARKVGKEAAEQVSEQAIQEVLRTGFVRGAVKDGTVEFATEALQGGQERLAANIAVGREGFDVGPMRGVVGQATLEGALGSVLGGAAGGISARVAQRDAREVVALRDAQKAAEEAKQSNAPASAAAVEEQIEQVGETLNIPATVTPRREGETDQQWRARIEQERAETPDQRVARLQREAQEAAGEIELEEEVSVSGLPPVEPTPPVTPTPEAAVAPVEPVVPVEGAVEPVVTEVAPEVAAIGKPPEQMTPEESRSSLVPTKLPPNVEIKFAEENGKFTAIAVSGNRQVGRLEAVTQKDNDKLLTTEAGSMIYVDPDFRRTGIASSLYAEIEKNTDKSFTRRGNQTPLGKALFSSAGKSWGHAAAIENAIDKNLPVSASAVDQYSIKLPDGYTQQGDLYVYQPTPEAAPAAVEPTPVTPTPVTPEVPTAVEPPALAPLRRVVKAEQTEEDVSGLVGQGLVELYNGQPVITQAGLETLPEAERPRLTPEARKIQIDTRTSEAAAEAISKNLRIGVDQVPPDVRMPAGWTIEGDIYIPPVVKAAPEVAAPEAATAETRLSQFIQPKERPDLVELPDFKSFEMDVRGVPVRFDIDTTKSDENTLYLESFRVPRGERRQGIGREAMTNILRWADENNVTLKGEALTAPADRQYRTPQEMREQGYMTPRELFNFYQTLGWEADPEGPTKTMGIPMVYRPKQATVVGVTPEESAVLQKPTGSPFQTPEEFRAAFNLRGQGHARFAIRLDLMQEDGALTEDGKNLILATIWDNNTNDEFLSNMEMGSARKTVKSYGFGGRSRQTVEGGRVEQKPLLELIRATRRGGTEADKRTALTLNTFWHEFGHAGYYSLLDAKQKKAINDAYNKTTRAGRMAFFAEGKADIENTPWFSKYYAKNESEWFAQSFAEYVITQKSDQKGLVPVFEQLLDKIKAVFTKLFNREEQVNLNDIFDFILRGEAYGQGPTWQGYTMSTKPAVYGTPRGQAISPEFTKRLLEREQPTTFEDERRQQIIDGISLKFKRSKNEYGNNEFKAEYDFGGRSQTIDKISFSLEQFDDSTVAVDYFPIKGWKYASVRLLELEESFKGRAAAERAIKRVIAEIEMDERVGGAKEAAPEAPTFTEESPEAKTLSNLKASMEKVDSASEAKGGKPETQKVSEIAANWMESGGDERALQDAITENTNLSPANAAKVAKVIAKQYDIQQSIATAFLETQTGLSVEALPEGVTLPKEVDPDRPKPVMQRLFDVFMGVRVPPVKIQVNEKTALKQQIRLKAAANRAAKAEQKRTAEEVVGIIKAMELLGPVRPKQVQALAKRAARVIWTNEKSVEAFSEYAAKVVENANYDADLREAKDAQKRAKQLSTQKKVAMGPQREVLEDVSKVPVNKLDDPRMFAEAVNYYLRGFKSVLSPDYVVIPDAEMESYLSGAQSETQRNQRDLDREANRRLAEKYGIDPDQVNQMMESIDIIKQIEAQENRDALENLLTEKAVETQQGLRGYDTDSLRADQRSIVSSMLKVDPKALDPEERQRFIRITNNIIYNNQTNGAEYFVAVAKGQQSAREAAQDSTMVAKNRAWINLLPRFVSERMQRGWALELQSISDTFRNAFGKGAMAKMYDAMGMLDLNLGFTKANNTIDEIQEKIAEFHRNLEKKYKAAARNQDGLLAEGVVGFLIQSVPKKDEVASINQRRDLIRQDIANRKGATGEPDRVAMAGRIETILNQIDGDSVEAILNNMKREFPANHESLVWYKDTLLPQYKDFLKGFDENFNDQANNYENPNYLTIGFTSAGPSLAITPEEQGMFYDQVSLRPKQSAYTIKRVDYSELPKDRTTGKPKEIEFNLRRNVFNGLSDQINKAYTSSGWQRIASFMKTPEAEVVFGGAANKDFFIERLNRLRLSRMRRGSMGSGGAIEKAVDSLSVISRKLGTGIALGGIYQWIKQPPDQLITAWGSGGRGDLLAKNIAPSTQKLARELLNKFSIGRRGDASAGYKYINQMEGHQNRLERYFSESKWDQAKEQAGKIADVWMIALKSSDFLAASAAWMTYYEGELNKQDIKIDDWSKEADLIESDPKRRQAAAFAEQMTDIYQGSSDPTSMATFAQSGKTGWENLVKAIFVPFNSFAIQQRMRLYSDARDAINGSKGGAGGLAGTIGGLILFHATKRYAIPAISGAGIAVLYGLMGVDMEEPDEEKQKEEANKNWRQFLADITGNLLVGGTPQIVESQFIDAMNRASYLVSIQLENDSILNDDGEIMSYDQYSKERSPFYRYKSFDNAMSLGMLDIGMGQAEQVALQTKMLATPEEMEMYTPEEQRLLYFSALSEWLLLMRLNDTDFARLVGRARRDMIKAAKDRETELQRIRSGR